MKVSKNNLLFILLFAGGIILPTAILSFLSFRNIQNEMFLAQKNFTENRQAFQNELEDAIANEQSKIFNEVKTASLFLYEQPQHLLDFGNETEFKSVDGIDAIFLFNKGQLVYPDIFSKHYYKSSGFSSIRPTADTKKLYQVEKNNSQDPRLPKAYMNRVQRGMRLVPFFFDNRDDQIQSILGLIRFYYKAKNYNEALDLLRILEQAPHQQGYLTADLTRSANLLHFDILVEQKKHKEAQEYCLSVLKAFLEETDVDDISSSKFFFESAFTQILSFENLPQDKREAFWNLRENFNRQLGYMDIFSKNQNFFQEVIEDPVTNKDGISFSQNDETILLKMAYPFLSGDQQVIAKIDRDAFKARILGKIKSVAKSWKGVPFVIVEKNDQVLLGQRSDSSSVINQIQISEVLNWELTLYEKDMQDIRKETRQRMFLMYGLMLFALITVVFGSFFMFRFINQERKLLSMKANFLSSVSHELKTPLTSIKMFSEMMARGRVQKVEKVQEYSGLIGKEATRLENLIGAILNYTRMEHGSEAFKWERLDFTICAQKVFDAVQNIAIEKGLEITASFEPGCYVMGDYTALYSLAQNLIENAIKYTNAPGEITVRTLNKDNQVVFAVTDTGVGIDSSEQKNIFNDFYRVGDEMTRSTKGSGLGLAIVKRVAETHRATISLVSKLGKGSTFTVRFKRAE
ncbi:MAG: HAMP domain-containing histidine kinase [Fibrobacter sp.]|nr:HAMP domain-containing histidine kinase [Fibrobacter sp.]